MAINLPQGFNIGSNESIDQRLLLTKEQMKAALKGSMPEKYFCVCKDDGKLYIYNSENEIDPEIGRFRLALSDELKEKQDKLTAGENITIKNNVISSTGAGKTYKAGANIQISNDLTISATDTIYDDTEIKAEIEDAKSNISEIEGDVSELNADVTEVKGSVTELTTKTTQIETNLGTVSEKVDTIESDVGTLKSDVETAKADISTAKSDIETAKADISSLQEEVGEIEEKAQPKLIAGENITITEDNVISATGGGSSVLTQELTVGYDVGGVKAGTVYPVGTTIENIIRAMLYKETPIYTSGIYTGIVDTIPTSVSGLTKHDVSKETLLTNGYIFEVNTNNQYAVLAVDKTLGLKVKKIEVSGFTMGFNERDIGEQYLYCFDDPTYDVDAEYVYSFKEV